MLRTLYDFLQDYWRVFFLSLPMACLLVLVYRRDSFRRLVGRFGTRLCATATVAGVLAQVIYSVHYLALPSFNDHVEPTIVLVARHALGGQPIYHELDSASRYSVQYGPNTYLAALLALRILGDSVVSVKVVAAGFAVGALAMVTLAVLGAARQTVARAVGILYFLLIIQSFGDTLVWVRADPQILFWVGLACCAATRLEGVASFALIGLCCGAAMDNKVHAILYFIPLLPFMAPRSRIGDWLALGATGMAAIIFPFLLPVVSLPSFLRWLGLAVHHGIDAEALLRNFGFVGLMLLPLIIARLFGPRLQGHPAGGWYAGAGLLAVSAAALVGSKAGAGLWHLMPFAPVGALWIAVALDGGKAQTEEAQGSPVLLLTLAPILTAGLVAMVVSGLYPIKYWLHSARNFGAESNPASDVRAYLARHPGESLAVGVGDDATYATTFARSEVRPSPRFLLEASALMDMQQSGLTLPPSTYQAIRDGAIGTWLIPQGTAPFTLHNYYAGQDLFGEEFRAAFHAAYERTGSTAFFDVWSYRGAIRRGGESERPPR